MIYQGEWKNYLPPKDAVKAYTRVRGISPMVLEAFRIGQVEKWGRIYMTIPCFHNDVLQGIKLRLVEGSGTRYQSLEGSRAGLFNYDGVVGQKGTVFVVKGEIAAMVLETHGYASCAPTNGECGDMQDLLPVFNFAEKIVLISDNDPKQSTRKQISQCAKKRAELLNASLVYPPEEYKDIDQWLVADPKAAKTYLDSLLGGTNESHVYRWKAPNPKQPQRRWAGSLRG
jgi:hypothetical protein